MKTIIEKPKNISPELLEQIIALVAEGDQIPDIVALKGRILNADFVALKIDDNGKVVSTATIKNPNQNYTEKVFTKSHSKNSSSKYTKELGYIVTHPDYEGKKHCQDLLLEIADKIKSQNIFATTRKDSMIHVLGKFGFQSNGVIYDDDLRLLTFTLPE